MKFINILSAFLTPIIGLTTISILVLQYLLQRYRVRKDLYEPRIKIYRAVNEFLMHANQHDNVSEDTLTALIQSTTEARFLFRGKIRKHIYLLHSKGLKLQIINKRLDNPHLERGGERDKLVDALEEHSNWFSIQVEKTNKLFSKYLTLDE